MLILLTILRLPYRGVRWLVLHAWYVIRATFLGMAATPGIVFVRGPVGAYRKLTRFRNWLLAKVEYLQSESAKWKTTFNILKSQYSLLRSMGFSPQMAVSFLVAGSAVGSGVVVNETLLQEPSFAAGDAGLYEAPVDTPVLHNAQFNTLQIALGTVPVKEINISDVSVGTAYTSSTLPSGATTTIDIGGLGSVSTYLEIGHLIFEKNRCTTLLLTDVQAHTLNIEGNASDGQSIAPVAGTMRMRAVGGGHHMAQAMVTDGGLYDRIWINAPTSGVNGKIDKLTISNAFTKGGSCWLHRIKAGTVDILLNEIGAGDGFDTKYFTIETSVKASVINQSDNVEISIAPPATVTADS